jgi:hypothetical protein
VNESTPVTDQIFVPQTAPVNADNDFRRLGTVLKRSAGIIAASAALAAGTAYLLSARQTPVYQSSASLITVRNDGGSSLLNGSVFAAPSLPRGALQEALQSSDVRGRVVEQLQVFGKSLPAATLSGLTSQVRGDIGSVLNVQAQGSGQQDGVFDVKASATSPQAAPKGGWPSSAAASQGNLKPSIPSCRPRPPLPQTRAAPRWNAKPSRRRGKGCCKIWLRSRRWNSPRRAASRRWRVQNCPAKPPRPIR